MAHIKISGWGVASTTSKHITKSKEARRQAEAIKKFMDIRPAI